MEPSDPRHDLVVLSGGAMIASTELPAALGWELKDEGLCRGDECVIVPDRSAIERDGQVDLNAFAALLNRPIAIDEATSTVAIGAPRQLRTSALDDLRAPDFTLEDLDGAPQSLSDHRSKKRLLVAFSSW